MSLLDVGTKCAACGVVDFLPFSCSGCSGVFCREHVQEHPCSGQPTATATDSARKRIRGTCAARGCTTETIESIGGYEGSYTDGGGEGIARSVRCVCGGAFCVT
jgi:hypothetical protein